MSFESGQKGGSGLCLGERDFDLNVSTKTQWQQKEKIADSFDSCDRLMTMAAPVVVLVAYSNCGQWWRTAAALCSVGTSEHRGLANHAHGTVKQRANLMET